MKYGLSESQFNEIIKIISSYPEIEELVLFGSRAIDTFKEASDIDLAIKWKKVNHKLIANLKFQFEEETDLPFFFDFISYPHISNKNLKEHIDKYGIVIYRKGWKKVKLGDIADVRDGTHDSPKAKDHGKFLITSRHIKNGQIVFDKAYKISLEDFETVNKRSKVDKWDILFSMIGTIGELALVDAEPDFAIKNIGLFKTNDKNLSYWIFYYLKSPVAKNEIFSRMKGSTQQYITLGDLRSFPVLLPPISERQAIAEVLSSLDDKIELLHKQNKTLENMAQTLFHKWFIEDAKDDWKEKPLGELVDIAIGRTPPRKESKWFSKSSKDWKWISIKDMKNNEVYIFNSSEYLTDEAVKKFNIPIILEDTVVLSFKMTLGRVTITTGKMLSNEAIAQFKFNSQTPFNKEYLYLFLKKFNFRSLGSTSSIVTSINSSMIKNIFILIPDSPTMDKFHRISKPVFEKIFSNQSQIIKLKSLQDTLLPKLMNGAARVRKKQSSISHLKNNE